MIESVKKTLDAKSFFFLILVFLIATDLAIFLNIPFLRQILGFLFLTILPGLLILQILKLNEIGSTEKIVLSVGLSISFLMFFGLLWNNLLLNLGYETPLSTISLLISFNIAFIALGVIGCKINKEPMFSLPNLNLSVSEKAFLIVPILFPALSIFGMYVMNTTNNNIIVMFMLFLIPACVASVCFFNQKFPKRLYPVVIFSISLSLLLIYMLRFPHIYGHDVHSEYFFFQTTLSNLHWSILEYSLLDACLAISLLPTIYQSVMNINAQEYLFKGIYVSICSFGPLAIYLISKKYVGDLYAFLASFFFISQVNFLDALICPRATVAIFFAALMVMVFFNDKIEPLKRRIVFIVFMLSVVVSHYSTAYIFFFIMLFSWSVIEIFSKRYTFKKNITLTVVLLFFAFIFFWYSQVTETAFNAGVGFVENIFINLNKFFITESRTGVYVQLAGKEAAHPILSRVNLVSTWGTFILIGIGVLTMLKRYKEMIFISNIKRKKPDFLKTKFEMEYFVMVLACAGLLIIMVALPYLSQGYSIYRLYSLMTIILSVCFIMGGMTLSHFFFWQKKTCAKRKSCFFGKAFFSKERFDEGNGSEVRAYLIILLILTPYFLFVTGAMYQICGAKDSIILNSGGEIYNREYVHDQDSSGAKWLMNYGEENVRLYTDRFGIYRLTSQGKFYMYSIDCRSFPKHRKIKGYLYLYYNNIVNGNIYESRKVMYNISDYADMFTGKNKIFANGGSEVYK